MSADAAAQTVLSFYSFPPGMVRRLENLGNAGGWSGSQIWKIELASSAGILPAACAVGNFLRGVPGTAAPAEFLCLRRHPESWKVPDRLRFVHKLLARVHAGGLSVVPVPLRTLSGETILEHTGFLWELTPWMPGAADFHARPTRARLRCALQTLARFHLLAVTEGVPRVSHNLAPAVFVRQGTLRRIREHAARIEAHLRPGLGDELDARATRLLHPMRDAGVRLAPQLAPVAEQQWFQQPVIRDIWHDHVLFTGDEVTGIVDFGAVSVDTPLTDIARLVGSLVGDDSNARRFALEAYADLRPLTEEDLHLVDLLDASGQLVAAVNWLTWLYVDRRDMGPVEPIIRRLDEILRRLEHLATH
jgi:Ser/Thr protein kinase RdoA (MazF antagonist)